MPLDRYYGINFNRQSFEESWIQKGTQWVEVSWIDDEKLYASSCISTKTKSNPDIPEDWEYKN